MSALQSQLPDEICIRETPENLQSFKACNQTERNLSYLRQVNVPHRAENPQKKGARWGEKQYLQILWQGLLQYPHFEDTHGQRARAEGRPQGEKVRLRSLRKGFSGHGEFIRSQEAGAFKTVSIFLSLLRDEILAQERH